MSDAEDAVAVIDDIEEQRESLVELIQDKFGIPAFPFASGQEFLDAARERDSGINFLVISSDHIMPGMSGTELFKTIATDKTYRHLKDARRMEVSGQVDREGSQAVLDDALDRGYVHAFHRKADLDEHVRLIGQEHATAKRLQMTKTGDFRDRITLSVNGADLDVTVYRPVNMDDAIGSALFMHGLGYPTIAYGNHFPEISAHNLLGVVPSRRGHRKERSEFTWEADLEDMLALQEAINKEYGHANSDRWYTIAHSTAGIVAQALSNERDSVRANVWVSPVDRVESSYRWMFQSGHIREVRDKWKQTAIPDPDNPGEEISMYSEGLRKIMEDPEGVQMLRDGRIDRSELAHAGEYGTMKIADMGQFFRDVIGWDRDIYDVGITKPLFVVGGRDDQVVSPQAAVQVAQLAQDSGVPVKFYQTGSTDHFQREQWPGIFMRAVDYIKQLRHS